MGKAVSQNRTLALSFRLCHANLEVLPTVFHFLLIQILPRPIQRPIYSQSVTPYLCFWSMVRSNIMEAIFKHKKQTKCVFQNYMKEGSLEIAAFFYITVFILAYLPNWIKPTGRQDYRKVQNHCVNWMLLDFWDGYSQETPVRFSSVTQ